MWIRITRLYRDTHTCSLPLVSSSSTGFAILNMAGEAVLQLGLHREPDPVLFTPLEANIRRNTFWWTVLLEAQAGASLGKTW